MPHETFDAEIAIEKAAFEDVADFAASDFGCRPPAAATIFAARRPGELLGFIAVFPPRPPTTAEIAALFVTEPERGKGLGRRLIEHVERRFGETRVVVPEASVAARFFRKIGFECVGSGPDVENGGTLTHLRHLRAAVRGDSGEGKKRIGLVAAAFSANCLQLLLIGFLSLRGEYDECALSFPLAFSGFNAPYLLILLLIRFLYATRLRLVGEWICSVARWAAVAAVWLLVLVGVLLAMLNGLQLLVSFFMLKWYFPPDAGLSGWTDANGIALRAIGVLNVLLPLLNVAANAAYGVYWSWLDNDEPPGRPPPETPHPP